jgi:hypothetical protein
LLPPRALNARAPTLNSLVECAFQPRPFNEGRFHWLRQAFLEGHYERYTDHRGNVGSWNIFTAPFYLELESGDRVEVNWYPQYEFLKAPFEIVPGLVIPPGAYRFTRERIQVLTSQHRRPQASSTTWRGTFYNGTLSQWQQSVQWTSGAGRVQIGVSAENDFGHLKRGNFVQRLWQRQWALAWSPNLVFTAFIQYDTGSQNVGASTRLRWTIRPGNDLFVVWNRGW